MQGSDRDAILMALLAAALFGGVVPASRILLTGIGPVTLAGLLYAGAGTGGLIIRQILSAGHDHEEAPVRPRDIPWLIGIIITGSIMAPILFMTGLESVPASTGSLLLNGELACTALIAVVAFREHLGRRGVCAVIAVITGGLILTCDPSASYGFSPGSLLILLACFCWGLDNNFTRLISGKDPAMIVMVKGWVAGFFGILLGYVIGEPVPSLVLILVSLIIGCAGYGFSIFFVIKSLRILGSSRTMALFASAPFIGLVLSLPLPGENPGPQLLFSLPFMAAGAWLIATEEHGHLHCHLSCEHEHRHRHDDGHHRHHHETAYTGTVHSHVHVHEPSCHTHSHTPDLHHGHDHGSEEDAPECSGPGRY